MASDGSVLIIGPLGGGVSWALARREHAWRVAGTESAGSAQFGAFAAFAPAGGVLPADPAGAADLVVGVLAGAPLGVDDADLLTDDELDLLLELVPRTTSIVGCHVGTRRGLAVADRLRGALPVEVLAPVSPDDIVRIVRQHGSDLDDDAATAVVRRAGGLPGVARALATGTPLAEACIDRFRRLVGELDADTVDWIRNVAVLPDGWPPTDAGVPPDAARERMLVGPDGRPAPALLTEIVARGSTPAAVADRRATLAASCPDPIRAARLFRFADRADASRSVAREALAAGGHDAITNARLAALAATTDAERHDAVAGLLSCELASEIDDLVPGSPDAVLGAGIARQLDLADRPGLVASLPDDAVEAIRSREWLDARPAAAERVVADRPGSDGERWRWQRSIALDVLSTARLDALLARRPDIPPTAAWRITTEQLSALAEAHRNGPTDAVLHALAPPGVHPVLPHALLDAHRAVLLADLGRSAEAASVVAGGPRSTAPIDRALHVWAACEVELAAGHPLTALRMSMDVTGAHAPPAWFATLAGAWGAWEVGEALPRLECDVDGILFALVAAELAALRALASDDPSAASAFAAAADGWRGRHVRGELRARWASAEATRRHGDRDRAVDELLALESRVGACSMAPLLQRVRRSLRLAGVQRRGARRANEGPLSAREVEVIELVGKGLATRDIALRLGVAESTIETQVTAAMHKLGARTRLQAAARYRELQR